MSSDRDINGEFSLQRQRATLNGDNCGISLYVASTCDRVDFAQSFDSIRDNVVSVGISNKATQSYQFIRYQLN